MEVLFSMNSIPLMGKFERKIGLIPCSVFLPPRLPDRCGLSHFLAIISLGIPCYKMNHDVGGELVAPMEMVDSWQRCGEFLLLHQQRTAL